MDVKLVVEQGPARTRVVEVHSEETVIGRRRDCDVCIPSALVSRRHCLLTFANGLLSVEDLNSSNGTYLNDQRLTGKAVVRPGDRLRIGPLTFTAQYEAPAAAANPLDFAEGSATEEVEEVILEPADGSASGEQPATVFADELAEPLDVDLDEPLDVILEETEQVDVPEDNAFRDLVDDAGKKPGRR